MRRPSPVLRPWHRGGTGLRAAFAVLLGLIVLPVLFAVLLLARLLAGPVDLSAVAARVLPRQLSGGATLHPGRLWLSLRMRDPATGSGPGPGPGTGPVLLIRVAGLSVSNPDGTERDRVGDVTAAVSAPPLLLGRLRPLDLSVSDTTLRLDRDPAGMSLGAVPPPRTRRRPASRPLAPDWTALRALHLSGVAVTVHDRVLGQDWGIRAASAALHPSPGGVAGHLDADAFLADRHAMLHAAGAPAPDGNLVWRLAAAPITPAVLAGVLPALHALALPVAPTLTLAFATAPGRFMDPVRADLALVLGAGSIDTGHSLMFVHDGSLDATLHPAGADPLHGPARITLDRLRLVLLPPPVAGTPTAPPSPDPPPAPAIPARAPAPAGPTLTASGTLDLDDLLAAGRIRAGLAVGASTLRFDTLADYWPVGVARGARRWILRNITGGEASGLHVDTRLASDTGWSGLAETARSGGFDAKDLTLWWLRPIPPLRHMDARLVFDGTDAVRIDATHAVMPVDANGPLRRPSALALRAGSMRITGLEARDQIGTVSLHLTGPFPALLGELAHPRLHLLSRHPFPFTDPSGHVDARITVSLPLDSHVSTEQIRLRTEDHLTDLHLGNVAAGHDLDRGNIRLSADNDGLSLSGTADLLALPATLSYARDFRAGPPDQVTERATLSAPVTTAALRAEGLDPGDDLSGAAALSVDYRAHRDGQALVSLGLDLGDLGVSTAVWNKARGVPATATATIALLHGHLRAIDHMRAEGPGLSVQARTELRGGRPERVVVGGFRVGRSVGSGSIALPPPVPPGAPPAPIRVVAHGTALDLSAVLEARKARGSTPERTAPGAARTPWEAVLAFDRVFVGRTRAFSGVRAAIRDDGARIERLRLDAAGPTPVSVRIDPAPGGRVLAGRVEDAGRLLSALGATDAFAGGRLALDGWFDDTRASSPLAATLRIGPFTMPEAPRAARVARDLTGYGWLLAPPAPALRIDALDAPFTFDDGVVTLRDARVHDAALGATAGGTIDTARGTLRITGTLVPAWAVNRIPGTLPLVGRLFSPEKGGGLFAATYAVTGPIADPRVRVNPWSLLLPGALRRLAPP